MNNPKKRRLGRGLEALLGPHPNADRSPEDDEQEPRILPLSAARATEGMSPEGADMATTTASRAATGTTGTAQVAAPFRSAAVTPSPAPHTAVVSGATPSPGAAAISKPISRETSADSTAAPVRPRPTAASTPRAASESWGAGMSDDYDTPTTSRANYSEPTEGSLVHLSVDRIVENPFQPRREFSESELASLSESLKEHDMLQPILVRRVGDGYQIISGERRWRAAQLAGWTKIPARLRQADDRLVAELAIVENLQRKDLNALEKALSFRRYLQEHESTQEELAGRLKIDRSTIANLIRLLDLPELVQDSIRSGAISAGHARALLPLGNASKQIEYCNKVQRETWSVRETERRVMESIETEDRTDEDGTVVGPRRKPMSPQIQALEQQLRRALGTSVEIRSTARGKGKIVIHFGSNDEFIRIRERLTDDGSDDDLRRVG